MIAERECVIEALRRLKGVESIRCVVFHAQFSRGTHTRDAGPDGGGVCEGKTGQNAGASGFADGPASEVGKRDAGVQETRDLKGMVRDMDGRAGIYDLEASGLASALFQMGVASVGVGVQLDGQGGADRQTGVCRGVPLAAGPVLSRGFESLGSVGWGMRRQVGRNKKQCVCG